MLPAAILAGGLATRLRPVTEKIPKALVEIDGEPFLAHQLRLLAANNIRNATLCVGHLSGNIREYASDGSRFGIELTYSFDGPTLLGTAGALAQALPLLGEHGSLSSTEIRTCRAIMRLSNGFPREREARADDCV